MDAETFEPVRGLWERHWRQLLLAIVAGALVGFVFSFSNRAFYEGLVQLSSTPENAADTGHMLTFWWAIAYVLGGYLVPVFLAYVVAGRGTSGWVGVGTYAVVWWYVASMVPVGTDAESYLLFGIVLFGLYRVIKRLPERVWSADAWIGTGLER